MRRFDASLQLHDLKESLDIRSVDYIEQGQYAIEVLFRAGTKPAFILLEPGINKSSDARCFEGLTKAKATALMERLVGLRDLGEDELLISLEELGLDDDDSLEAFGIMPAWCS